MANPDLSNALRQVLTVLQDAPTLGELSRCAFCHRGIQEVGVLVPGFDAKICDLCIEHAHDVVVRVRSGETPITRLPTPKDPGPEGVRERTRHVKSMLDVVDQCTEETRATLKAFVENLLAYLDSVPSTKLLLTLPWEDLESLESAFRGLGKALTDGRKLRAALSRQ